MLVLIVFLILIEAALSVYVIVRLVALPHLLPAPGSIAVHVVPAKPEELFTVPPVKLLELLYKRKPVAETAGEKTETVRLVRYMPGVHEEQQSLMRAVNTYLIRCHFTQADAGWISATATRYLAQYEQQLKFMLFVPLLLGALCSLIASPAELVAAHWALSIGLLLSIALIIIYQLKQQQLAQRKNHFHDFLQNELLQPMRSGFEDNVLQLRNELHQFSTHLGRRVNDLIHANKEQLQQIKTVQEQQVDAINRETAMLDKISKMDFAQVVRFNTDVLNQLKDTLKDFGLFTHLASSLGALLGTMDKLTAELNRGVERTGEIGRIADAVYNTVQRNAELQEFLTANMKVLANRKELVQKTVGGIDLQLTKSFEELRQHIVLQLESIRKITFHEHEQIEESIRAGRMRFEKMDRLDELATELVKLRTLNEEGKPVMGQVILQLTQLNAEAIKLRTTMEKRRLL